jgi:hypothetical protein
MTRIRIGDLVNFRGNLGKVIEETDKGFKIYCNQVKGRVPYSLDANKNLVQAEAKIL